MTLASERSKQCYADCYLSGLAQSAFLIAERLNANLLLIGKSAQKPVFASRSSGYLALKSLQAAEERKKKSIDQKLLISSLIASCAHFLDFLACHAKFSFGDPLVTSLVMFQFPFLPVARTKRTKIYLDQ